MDIHFGQVEHALHQTECLHHQILLSRTINSIAAQRKRCGIAFCRNNLKCILDVDRIKQRAYVVIAVMATGHDIQAQINLGIRKCNH